ncbi:MAG: ABC transporter permease subunit [Planctomycetes bacterium]|nr:ABC transporter permease subunit [Planctomycetota bacterium]
MNAILHDLGRGLWRLIPANPILVRVVYAGGRRLRHLWLRTAYLAILAAVVVIGVLAKQSGQTSLTDLAKNATQVFQIVSIVQLAMVCILAPLFTAAAITQEKDSQTFNILLSTPLSDAQIVLGALLSRLYFVVMLLVASIPLFCIMMVYGGVTGDKIALSLLISACTAAFTGSIAIAISVIKIGTGRTIFSFYLAIAMYLIAVFLLSGQQWTIPPESAPAPGQERLMSWLAPFHPFLALWVVLGMTPAPLAGSVAHYGSIRGFLLAYPQYSYILLTLGGSAILIFLSLFFVRRSAKEGEDTLWSRTFGRLSRSPQRDTNDRKPRRVWHNPVAWREAVTSAAAGGGGFVRYSMLSLGVLLGLILMISYWTGRVTIEQARNWLYLLVVIELLIALFITTATAATSMTREKESNTMELLLSTPLTSHMIIKGKIAGLVASAGPLLAIPLICMVFFIVMDMLTGRLFGHGGIQPVIFWESILALAVLMVAFTAFACMLGLQSSIKSKKTLTAVFTSMGIVIGVYAATAGCAMAVSESDAKLAATFMPINPFTAPFMLIDPAKAVHATLPSPSYDDLLACRIIAFMSSLASAAIYGLVGYGMHRSMVRNFDMIIRKQSA